MASASTMTRGPVFGSVPDPEKMPPIQPCATTHMTNATTPPAARKIPGRRESNGPNPMIRDTMANTHPPALPTDDSELPRELRKWSNQLGFPDAMSVIAPEMEPLVRF